MPTPRSVRPAMTPRLARFIVSVIFFTALAGILAGVDVILPWHPFSSFGFDSTPDGTITDVVAGMPAARAGLLPGDHIDVSQLSLHDRRFIGQLTVAPNGTTVTYPVTRGRAKREVTLTAVPRPRSLADNVSDLVACSFAVAFIVIAGILLLLRPSVLTWSFFLFATAGTSISISIEQVRSDAFVFAIEALGTLMAVIATPAMIVFAMLFPRTVPTRTERYIIWLLAAVFFAVELVNLATGFSSVKSSAAFAPQYADALTAFNSIIGSIGYVVAVIIFVVNYVRSDEAQRKRMQWVALGFALGTGLLQVVSVIQGLMAFSPSIWLLNVLQCFNILVPISVAYAVLKHRVIDVRFFVSRALVYGAITTVAVATLALLEFLIARSIEGRNFGFVVELAGAVAIGLGINRLHSSIDRVVDRFVFRSVHLAEQHLERIGAALMFAESTAAIDRMFVQETIRALDLESASVVREFDPDDPLALQLHAQPDPIEDGDRLYTAIIVRHGLLGYVVFGHHRSGAAIDPNERAILMRLTHQAATAYDHVLSEERRAENERLRTELIVERAKNEQLRSLFKRSSSEA